MSRIIQFLSVVAVVIAFSTVTVLAQGHHPATSSKGEATTVAANSPMQQKMMGGKGMMQGGMSMMQGKSMMGKCKKMQGGMMMGKGMHGAMGMMAMNDPVIKALHNYGCPGFVLKLTSKLELSEKQIDALKALKTDFQKKAVTNKAEIDVAKIELKELLDATSPDFSKVKAKVNQIGSLEQQLRLDFLNKVVQARKLLTAEQLKKLKSLSGNGCKGMGMMGQGM